MSCCGQKRQAWREAVQAKMQVAATPPPVLQNPVLLNHLGPSSLVIKGDVSGFTYLFSGEETGLEVDARDVPTLMATGQFGQKPTVAGKNGEDSAQPNQNSN